MVHAVHIPGAQGAEAAVLLLQQLNLLVDRAGQTVLRQQLLERALLTLCGCTVVRQDVYDQGVVDDALVLQLIQELAMLRVRVLQVAGIDLHQPQLERPLALGDLLPLVHAVVDRRKLGRNGNPAHGLLLLERDVAHSLPAHVKLPLVLVCPLGVHVVGPMGSAWGKVDEEGAVWRKSTIGLDELHCLVRHILGQVVALLGRVRRLDRVRVLVQAGRVLVRLACQEAVEVAEAQAGRVLIERPRLQ
mmetsp:Transcript_44889/g.116323  ORF Transcript_44889/g.116323 Transcript_44889/m.116323 type:complete len:246 (+) Transcript_44889:1574-2311(+)